MLLCVFIFELEFYFQRLARKYDEPSRISFLSDKLVLRSSWFSDHRRRPVESGCSSALGWPESVCEGACQFSCLQNSHHL